MHPEPYGPFRIEKKLPGGGMGRVYRAVDTRTNTLVALKLIDAGTDQDSQDIVVAERQGAILQARLCGLDPRITRILEYGELDGYFYIAMEFVEGEDLSVYIRNRIGVLFAARIAQDICEVLYQAHNFRGEVEGRQYSGIVHGDIKPRNVRITHQGGVKVLDFGIAKALSLTRGATRNQFGSSQYSSKERLRTGHVDTHSDLWSVGVVLYEMATGRPYFQEHNIERQEHMIKNYAVLQPLPPELPLPLRHILAKALAPNQKDRYQTAREFGDALGAFVAGKPVPEPETSDMDATRRTAADPQATQRTAGEDQATRGTGIPVPPPLRAARKAAAPGPDRVRLAKALIAVFSLFLLGYFFVHEIMSGREATQLARELESEQLSDLDAAWERYQKLARESLLPLTTTAPRDALKARLLARTDNVIDSYRNSDTPTTSERDWLAAHAGAARVLTLFPGDEAVRGRMRLAEAHLDRIRGVARGDSKLLASARDKFQQAGELMKTPDAYLGLARLYAYSFRDVERTEDAIRRAEKLGHRKGKREKAQLADVYRSRGDRMWAEAQRFRGKPDEEDFLERARDDYKKARDIYDEIVPFSGATTNIARISDTLQLIELRRDEMRDED